MSLRQIQVRASRAHQAELEALCDEYQILRARVSLDAHTDQCLCLMTVLSGQTGPILNELTRKLGPPEDGEYFVAVLPVEASVPRFEDPPERDTQRTAREELLEDVTALTKLDRNFVLLVLLSSVIATLGLLADDVTVVIGAMVIAPLLGPALSLSLGVVMSDIKLLKDGALAEGVGLLIAVGIGYTVATLLPGYAPELSDQIQARTSPNVFHLVLALGSGFAGALSLTGGVSSALVGVMVAVALLVPANVVGIGLASANPATITGATLLLLANLMGVIVAATVAFRYKRIHPGSWKQVLEAKGSVRAVTIVVAAVLLLTVVPMAQVTRTTFQELRLRAQIDELAQQIVPGYGWNLSGLSVDTRSDPPLVHIHVQVSARPDAERIDHFRRAVHALINRPIILDITATPVEMWRESVP